MKGYGQVQLAIELLTYSEKLPEQEQVWSVFSAQLEKQVRHAVAVQLEHP
jgi:hypothetical protein